MSREFCVNHETMRKLVVEDLGMKSYKRKNVHHLNDSIHHKRLERCILLKARFAPGTEDQILFSDEKLFTVEEASNRQNDRILASRSQDIPDSIKYIDRVQKPFSLMVWAGVSIDSRTNLIIVPQGVKINSQTYRELVLELKLRLLVRSSFKTILRLTNKTLRLHMLQKYPRIGSKSKYRFHK
ncbi:Transposase [Oopsacas minuta]|uniref:Transposase n=1 Tax=Oopsacas minuta TaxID=111878 RepID=A0AAV7JED7_9METZ|nr:Transposase [Oopsacas minuta]